MSINIISILKDSLVFNFVGAITKVLMAFAMVYAAKVLGAEEYGIYGIILLWSQYLGLVRPGFVDQAYRDIPVLKSQNKDSYSIQNISISGEIYFSIFPFIILLCSSFLYDELKIKFSLLLLAFITIFTRVNDMWGTINLVRKKFNKVARARFIAGVVGPIIIFLFAKDYGVYILVIYSGIAAISSFIYYSIYSPIKFKFKIDKKILIELFRDGIILQLLSVSFLAFRLSDRTMISYFLSLEELGLYTFAANLALFLKTFVGEFHTVLQPIAWGKFDKKNISSFKSLMKTVYFISFISIAFIPLSQFVFYIIVNFYSPEYINSLPVFIILSLSTYFIAVGGIVGIILNSSTIKRYKLSLIYSLIGLILNVVLDYILIIKGYGIISIAFVTLVVQAFVSMLQFVHVRELLFTNLSDLNNFYFKIFMPFILLVALIFFNTVDLKILSFQNAFIILIVPLTFSIISIISLKNYLFEQ